MTWRMAQLTWRMSWRDAGARAAVLLLGLLVVLLVLADIAWVRATPAQAWGGAVRWAAQAASFLVIFLNAITIGRDVESKEIANYLSRPVSRFAYLSGRMLGVWMIGAAAIAAHLLAAALVIVLIALKSGVPIELPFMPAVHSCLRIAPVAALSAMFAIYTQPLLASLYSIGVTLAGAFSQDVLALNKKIAFPALQMVFKAVYWILPNSGRFAIADFIAAGGVIPPAYHLFAALYAAAYSCGVLALAMAVFHRRDIK
ncbi:MAG: hypothetical protein GMKNLPBB_00841 [Myxococcota bacterium]|nr:hypothetical protein [Myxococcota bacterium]